MDRSEIVDLFVRHKIPVPDGNTEVAPDSEDALPF